eukprot:gene14488-15992_t
MSKQIEANRAKLTPIVGAVILCGHQNNSLTGHHDDSENYDKKENHPGNLQEIIKYLLKLGDNSVFEDHIANAPKSATYLLKTTQNELILYASG